MSSWIPFPRIKRQVGCWPSTTPPPGRTRRATNSKLTWTPIKRTQYFNPERHFIKGQKTPKRESGDYLLLSSDDKVLILLDL